MEYYCGKDGKTIIGVETNVFIPGRKTCFVEEYSFQLTSLFLVPFPILVDVAKHLERIQRDFLWRGLGEDSKFHLVRWDKICTLYRSGGLALRNLKPFNERFVGQVVMAFWGGVGDIMEEGC